MKQITVTNFIGLAPFDVYLCDPGFNSCIWITQSTYVPVVFTVPSPYDLNTSFGVRIIDSNNCTVDQVLTLWVVFQYS